MRILGIDPGTSLIGYGIIDAAGSSYAIVKFGEIRSVAGMPAPERAAHVYERLEILVKEFEPEVIAVEKLFFFKNAKTVMAVSEMRGVIMLFAAQKKIPLREFTPLQVKQAVTGYGRAEKKQVQSMIKMIFGLKQAPKPDDVADALAIAVCCANTRVY